MDAPCPECGASIPVLSTGQLATHYRYKNKEPDGLCGGTTMTDSKHTPGPRAAARVSRTHYRVGRESNACNGSTASPGFQTTDRRRVTCPRCQKTAAFKNGEEKVCNCGPAFPGNEDIHLTGCPARVALERIAVVGNRPCPGAKRCDSCAYHIARAAIARARGDK